MDNRILSELMAQYAMQQQKNEQEEQRRRQEIQARVPQIMQLEQARHQMIMNSVRGAFSGVELSDAERQMAQYNQKIAALLTQHGFPADYLAPVYRCALCQDTGYVYDGPQRRACACLKKAYQERLSSENLAAEQTFFAFDETVFPAVPLPGTDVTQREYMAIVKQKCQAFAKNVPHGGTHTLLLHGGSGLGKTYLLNCVAEDARMRGIDTVFISAYDLLMALKNAFFSRGGEGAEEYFSATLLLVDDLGMEPLMENITVEQIYNLLSSRLQRGKYTAISTNLSRLELQKRYTERFTSRLLDVRLAMAIPFLGQDIRLGTK